MQATNSNKSEPFDPAQEPLDPACFGHDLSDEQAFLMVEFLDIFSGSKK